MGKCGYCGESFRAQTAEGELPTGAVCSIINSLRDYGMRFISFTGGEPFIREDIDAIIKHSALKGIFVKVNTNGYLVEKHKKTMRMINALQLSLDGDKEVNDMIRGRGSFEKTIQALETAKRENVPVSIHTVISQNNAEKIKEIIRIAKNYDVKIFFQPAQKYLFGTHIENPLQPSVIQHKNAVQELITLKRRGERIIDNSFAGLNHLLYWPEEKKIPCYAGRLSFRIDEKGILYNCDERREIGRPVYELGLGKALAELSPVPCSTCWSGMRVEFNLIMNMNIDAVCNCFR